MVALRPAVAVTLLALALTVPAPATSAAPGTTPAPAPTRLTAEQWRADLAFLAGTLPERHPKPFGRITREQWQRAVAELDARIPSLEPHEIGVGFARLVAMIGDAHTVANAAAVPPGFHVLPIRLVWFADGIHVAAVAKGNESLLGLRLARVGTTAVDTATRVVAQTFVDENEALHRTGAVLALTTPEILHAQRLIPDPARAPFTFEGRSGAVPVTLAPVENLQATTWVRWPEAEGRTMPLARSRPQSWYWRQRDPSGALLFIQYNRCADSPELKVADFVRQTLAEIDARPPRAVVVDLRYNGGGSSSLLEPLIQDLSKRKALNAPDRLFVLIGRQTFSSALMNAVKFRQTTRATLIGEATGGRPNHFGETRNFTLPHSGMSIQHSTKYFRQQDKDDDALYPDVRVEVRAADYGAGRDPVMDEVLRRSGLGAANLTGK